jgi:hypothetical protein
LARGRSGFEACAADDHSLGLFPSPRKAFQDAFDQGGPVALRAPAWDGLRRAFGRPFPDQICFADVRCINRGTPEAGTRTTAEAEPQEPPKSAVRSLSEE